MFKFGKNPPRAYASFGVAGLLDEKAHVFYETLFSSRHIGRVTDLLAVRLHSAGIDELKLRIMLMVSFFESYRIRAESTSDSLADPLSLECGVDEEKVAIGVGFTLADASRIHLGGMVERVRDRKPSDEFEKLICCLSDFSDRVIVRGHPPSRRFELVVLAGLPGKISKEEIEASDKLQLVLMDNEPEAAPPVEKYVELGDLDYPALLKDDAKGTQRPQMTGEMIAKIAGSSEPGLEKIVVKGGESTELTDALRVRGSAQDAPPDVITVKGQGGDEAHTEAMQVKSIAQGALPGESDRRVELYQEQIQALQNKIQTLETQLSKQPQVVKQTEALNETNEEFTVVKEPAEKAPEQEPLEAPEDEEVEEVEEVEVEEEEEQSGFFGRIKKIWSFKKEKDEDEEEEAEKDDTTAESKSIKGKANPSVQPTKKEKQEAERDASTEPGLVEETAVELDPNSFTKDLIMAVEGGGLDSTLKKIQTEAQKPENGKVKKYMEGMINELLVEKNNIRELLKKLNRSVRHKEMEFKNKERTMQEDLRRKEDLLKQKEMALSRSKDQISQMTMNMERVKSASHNTAGEALYKKKLTQVHGLLNAEKEENMNLKRKLEELKSALTSASRTQGNSQGEVESLQRKFEEAKQEMNDMKTAYESTVVKLEAAEKRSSNNHEKLEEMRKRLDQAMRIAVNKKQDLERMRLQVEQLERDKELLQQQLADSNKDTEAA